ncbi:TrlF family AAA-like ATPase [Yersinia mollaretii]|uniref:TrlF family AAA-like ATPase n=1 Tax=Yersinia mollaretii TaxID=33060 RepID=UPI0011AA9215|nr:DNA repair protein [Yersinia mollaretii]
MKGSEWNKWDLHIHSPMTWMAKTYEGPEDISNFVRKLGESEIKLIGLTNYFFFAENEIEIVRNEIVKQGLDITVLPNVELRISQPNKKGEWINIHLIFSEKVSTEKINEALSSLPITTKSAAGKTVFCTEKSLEQHKKIIDNITVDYEKLLAHMSSQFKLYSEMIIAVCPNGYGGYRQGTEGRSQEIAEEFDKDGHIILDSSLLENSLKARKYFLMTDRYPGATRKPVFRCSDAHGLEKIGTLYTWVKAKPTFEGLRQSLLEPEGRLRLEDNWPELRTPKVHFSRIDIGGRIFNGQPISFKELSIPLSADMVAIIGGRGTGKSLMLDGLQSRFTPSRPDSIPMRSLALENMTVELNKTEGESIEFTGMGNTYGYLHVSQGEIKDLCQHPGKISDEIKKMLRLPPPSFPPQLKTAIEKNLADFRTFFDFFNVKNEMGARINTPEFHKTQIDVAQKHINTLASEKNRHLIKTFQDNSKSIADNDSWIDLLENFRQELISQENIINEKISIIHAKNQDSSLIPPASFEAQRKSLEHKLQLAGNNKNQRLAINKDIVEQFRSQGIEQDISGLLDKVAEYQRVINRAKSEFEESERRIESAQKNVMERKELATKIMQLIEDEKDSINIAYSSLSERKPHYTDEQQKLTEDILQDIEIYGDIHFDREKFYIGVLRCMNGGKFRASRQDEGTTSKIEAFFNVKTQDDYNHLISGGNIITLPDDKEQPKLCNIGELFWKKEYFNSAGPSTLIHYLFNPDSISEYLSVKAEFKYKGKTVEKLSAGQRGTFYVCLKLATDPFGSPFVFDQPEDDLDNNFIMHHLVPLFRKIKEYRQVIIVTHNANLVVNCDAEQVLIAHNEEEVISYRCGALEDGEHAHGNSMRQAICDVLEGGHRAFEQRERKYGLLKPLL